MMETTDIAIVGGGLVGSSLAIALASCAHGVALIEARLPPQAAQPSRDERNLALARASVNGLRRLGVWPWLADHATAITQIHVSRSGDFGAARINAAESGVDAVGWTVPASKLGAGLQARLGQCNTLQRHVPAKVAAIEADDDGWQLTLVEDGAERMLHARLLVGADGSHSFIRDALGVGADTFDYGQALVVSTIVPERAMNHRAYERFADGGPVALLPLANGMAGLVLTVPADQADDVKAMDDETFAAFAQRRFGWRQGRLTRPGRRFIHPVARVAARSLVAERAVLVGNAAQTVHPVGAQGFNLGLRDALTLAELVMAAPDPGAANLLTEHAVRRAPDRAGVIAMSHGLVQLACMPQPMLAPLRSLGMLAFDRLPPLRRGMLRDGMGFRGQPPRAVLEMS